MSFELDGIRVTGPTVAFGGLNEPQAQKQRANSEELSSYLQSSELRGNAEDIAAVDELLNGGATTSKLVLSLFGGPHYDPRVSAAGRRVLNEQAPVHNDDDATKQILIERVWILKRILAHDQINRTIDLYWPRIVTGVLTLMDSIKVDVRVQGCEFVQLIAEQFAPRLESSGLIPVFWDAVVPSIGFLPPLADTQEVLKLHHPAVMAMTSLARKSTTRQHIVVLEGCVRALQFTQGNVELTTAFMDTLVDVCEKLQSIIIVHLSRLIPIIVAVLEDPFLDMSPKLCSATCRALAAVVKVAWPRIPEYKYDLALGLIKANALSEFLEHLPGVPAPKTTEPREVVAIFDTISVERPN